MLCRNSQETCNVAPSCFVSQSRVQLSVKVKIDLCTCDSNYLQNLNGSLLKETNNIFNTLEEITSGVTYSYNLSYCY